MKKALALVGSVLLVALIPFVAYGQNSSLWKFVGNLRPVVSTWRIDGPGGLSGSSLTVSNLRSCDTIDTNANGVLSCGTDASGAGGATFGTGQVITIGDNRYVLSSGDTMTGGLAIQNGNTHTPTGTALLTIRGVASGITLFAKAALRSSGALTWEGQGSGASLYLGGTFEGVGLTDCDGDTQAISWDSTTKRFVCGDDDDTNTTYTFGQGLTTNSTLITLTPSHSGTVIWATTALRSSGTLVWEGAASGATMTVSGQFDGVGLSDCDADNQSIAWDATTKRFSCGDDDDINTTYTPAQGLSLNGTVFRLNAAHSGTVIQATQTLASSGTLVWEGAASGASLYVATSIQGSGLTDCDLATQTLAWDSTTGRFSCGTDSDTTYSAGQGLTLSTNVFSVSSSISGSLLEFSTVSGTTVYATTSVRSSGAVTWEGTGSGAALYIGGSFQGAGLTDCDADGQTLAWDASSGRFSCGDDDSGGASVSAGQGLSLAGTILTLNSTISGSLLEFQTVSGSTVYASKTLASSGTLVWEGTGSGNALLIQKSLSTSGALALEGGFFQNGLADCDNAGEKPIYNLATGAWTCGTDDDVPESGDFGAGGDLDADGTITDAVIDKADFSISTDFGEISTDGSSNLTIDADVIGQSEVADDQLDFAEFQNTLDIDENTSIIIGANAFELVGTTSGSVLHANETLSSSGGLIWEGAASGATLYIGGNIGIGGTQTTKARLDVHGTISGALLTQHGAGNNFFAGKVGIGTTSPDNKLEVIGTISGSVLYGKNTVASSGSIVWEGQGSGAQLYIGGNIGIGGTQTTKARLDVHGTISGALLTQHGAGNNFFAGKVGIGTTSPDTKLDVVGTISGSSILSVTAVSPMHMGAHWTATGTNLQVGSGWTMLVVPPTASGFNVVGIVVDVRTAGTTNTSGFQVTNLNKGDRKIFSTAPTIDSAETSTLTAATPWVVNTSFDDVGGGDLLLFHVNTLSTTKPKGGSFVLILRKP